MRAVLLSFDAMSRTHLLQVAASRPAPPGGRRIGGAEVERRLKIVEEHLARGAPRSEIIAAVGLPARTVDGYLKRVRDSWRDDAHEGRQDLRSRSLSRLMTLHARLLEARAWSALVALERLITDIEGVRGGSSGSPSSATLEPGMAAPALSAETLRQRAPLLIRACARIAFESDDARLVEDTRHALVQAATLLSPEPSC
jgi:hypothetical protein